MTNAVQFFAHICKKFGFNPEDSNVLMSHHEGNVKGIASNHGDVEHIWSRYGLSMDQFRKDVKKAMAGGDITTVPGYLWILRVMIPAGRRSMP